MIRKHFFPIAIAGLCFALPLSGVRAQTTDQPKKFEVAAEFTSLTKPDITNGTTEPGFGGRFTYNLKKSIAVEGVGYFFPHHCRLATCISDNNGNITEGLFGLKAGKRFEKWGIFAKGRPGLVSFSQGNVNFVASNGPPFALELRRATHFAFDAGGVIEFYPTSRIVTRFDAGDTLIHYGRQNQNFVFIDPTGGVTIFPFTRPAGTRNNFQFSASVGFRF